MYPISRQLVQKELKVLNQKVDRDLQVKLNMLEKQYCYTRKILQQRRDSLVKEQRRVVMVKVCEPKAVINIAMKEIGEHTEIKARGVHTSDSRRFRQRQRSEAEEESRSVSAPPTSKPVRHLGNVGGNVSLMQMKNIATIDSISEKEVARQRRQAREEVERARRLQREALQKRVTAFIESLIEKKSCGNTGTSSVEPESVSQD